MIFIYEEKMGRKKLYKTEEEKREAVNRNSKTYYERNKEKVKEARMKRYYEKEKMHKMPEGKNN